MILLRRKPLLVCQYIQRRDEYPAHDLCIYIFAVQALFYTRLQVIEDAPQSHLFPMLVK